MKYINVNPSEKSPTFMLWDESHGLVDYRKKKKLTTIKDSL